MADKVVPKFKNDQGVKEIRIGVREFECIGASPPHDHPHVFLDMGQDAGIICPYCSTVFICDPSLADTQSLPEDCAATSPATG